MAFVNGLKTFFGGIPRTGGVKWAGLYSASILYPKGSIAAYQGSVYLKVSTAGAGTAPTDTSAWKFLGKAVSGSKTLRVNGKHNVAGAEYVDVQTATENSWEGDYESGKNYAEGQIVVHQGIVYIVIKDTNSDPTDDTAFAPVTELADVWDGTGIIISPTTNFTLSDGEALLTSDGQIFNITEE